MEIETFDELVERARGLARPDRRALLGLAGAPGAGKTTLAVALVAALAAAPPEGAGPEWVAHVPMDGYHKADVELDRIGRRNAKGAPDTFDAYGYAALLRRLKEPGAPDEIVFAPAFERDLEQPIANAMPVFPQTRLVVSEGNYILVPDGPWPTVREQFDEVWYVDLAQDERLRRLALRHERFGKPADVARAWIQSTDEPNARLIESSRPHADAYVQAP